MPTEHFQRIAHDVVHQAVSVVSTLLNRDHVQKLSLAAEIS
jgi:hypothetical protein